jgi:hypothetical protein
MSRRPGHGEWMDGLFGRMGRTRPRANEFECLDRFFFFFFSCVAVRGTHTPGYAHSAMTKAKDLLSCGLRQGPRSDYFVFWNSVVYIPLWGVKTVNEK